MKGLQLDVEVDTELGDYIRVSKELAEMPDGRYVSIFQQLVEYSVEHHLSFHLPKGPYGLVREMFIYGISPGDLSDHIASLGLIIREGVKESS